MWPGVIGATERNTAPYEYNPALSRQLLEEANYDPSNVINVGGRAARIPKQVELYEAIQGALTEVGINAEITVLEPSVRNELRKCTIGKAIGEVLEAQGKDSKVEKPTFADMQAALDKGVAPCATGHILSAGGFSNETLDFGRQVTRYLNCGGDRSSRASVASCLSTDPHDSPAELAAQSPSSLSAPRNRNRRRPFLELRRYGALPTPLDSGRRPVVESRNTLGPGV